MKPTYTYRCRDCRVTWEEQRDRNDPNLDRSLWGCPNPECFGPNDERLPFSQGVSFVVEGGARRRS